MLRHNPQFISQEEAGVLLDKRNRDLFLLRYFPHRIQKLEPFHLRLIDNAVHEDRGLTLYPAGHGKTTITSTLLPIAEFCEDPNVRIAVIGKNTTEAQGIIRTIQAELATNEQLIRDYGPFHVDGDEKPWSLGRMQVHKRDRVMKEDTVTVFGSGAKTVLGYRTDWTICDDVVTDKNSASETQRHATKEWFDLAVETGPEFEHSRLTVVGTLFDPEDLYHDLLDLIDPETGELLWKVQREDAIVEICFCGQPRDLHNQGKYGCEASKCEAFSLNTEVHVTLWPDRWPWRRLMRQKAKVGTLSFNKRYRNIAVDASRMVFREEYIKGGYIGKEKYPGCLDKDYIVGSYEQAWPRFAGFDPAVGLTRKAKFCAHVVLAQGSCAEHDMCYWVVDLHRDQMALPKQADEIIRLHEEYELNASMVEANSYQGGLVQVLEERQAQRGLALRISPHYTSRMNKPEPESGVQAMAPWFENGKVHIPWGNQESRRKMQQFIDELVMYPGRTTDTVMAFWFAWRCARESQPKFRSYNRLDKMAPVLRRRLGRRVVQNPAFAE